MDNNSQPNNGMPDLPPALDQDQNQNQNQPAPEQPTSTQPTPGSTGVNLESPVLTPTHFDGMAPIETIATVKEQTKPQLSPEEKKAKTYMVLSIVFGIIAVIGIFLGIFSLIANIETKEKLADANQTINNKNAIINVVAEQTGATINTPDDVPEYVPVNGYIYVTEWGIKFKIPDDLDSVSYILDQKYRPQVCFNAVKKGIKYFPAFADVDQNPGGMGCVTRVATYEGDSDKDTGATFGQKVYTYGEYNYFYAAPERTFSSDAAEAGLEDTAVQVIKNMISMNIDHYE